MKKKSIDWRNDPKSWLAHSLYMIAVYIILGILFTPTIGASIACMVIYIREVFENRVFEFWKWSKWDSIFDFVIPILVISVIFKYLPLPSIWSLTS